jgi:phosphatidate cytidylyltransferase
MLFPNIETYDYLIIGAAISILSTTGDLIESFLKRAANIKDSGNLFPGHGGMLDRVLYIIRWTLLLFQLL